MTRVALLGLLFLMALSFAALPGTARAADANCSNVSSPGGQCDDRQQATQNALSSAQARAPAGSTACVYLVNLTYSSTWSRVYAGTGASCNVNVTNRDWPRGADCPANTTWDANQNKCASQCAGGFGTDPLTNQCMDRDKCLARNSPLAVAAPRFGAPVARCTAGCEYAPIPGTSRQTSASGGATVNVNSWSYNGSATACSAPTPPPSDDLDPKTPPDKESCKPILGQTACVKPDGRQCATGATGIQHCWQPTEAGDKNNGPERQTRKPGNTPPPDSIQLPSGDTLVKQGTPITTTTTETTNTSTTTTTTTITNYTTTNGTNATGTGTDPKDGSTTGSKDKNGNSASGGGDCQNPPIVSGDAALNMVATQAWATRCAVEAGQAAKVTGDVGDCKSPFTVEGTNANAVKLRAARAQICPGEKGAPPDPNDYVGDISGDQAAKDGAFGATKEFGADGLDDTGLGFSRTCPTPPTFTVKGVTYTLSLEKLCEWIALGGTFVLILAAMQSLAVIGSSGNS